MRLLDSHPTWDEAALMSPPLREGRRKHLVEYYSILPKRSLPSRHYLIMGYLMYIIINAFLFTNECFQLEAFAI